MSMVTIRCCRCKTVVGLVDPPAVPAGERRTEETFQPCYVCAESDAAIREKGAAIRRAQLMNRPVKR